MRRPLTWNSKLVVTAVWELSQASPFQEAALAFSQLGGWLPRGSLPRNMKWELPVSKGLEPETAEQNFPYILSVKVVTKPTH